MTPKMRRIVTAFALGTLLILMSPWQDRIAEAQNLFAPVVRVNDRAITRFELEQRARMLQLFRTPGDATKVAREQLIEDRLKLDAAEANGIILEPDRIEAGMAEFASRANMDTEQFVRALAGAGVEEQTYRDFVRAGLAWRELVQARFGPRVSVSEEDLSRARNATSGGSGVRVLLSEIIMPAPPPQADAVNERAQRISQITSEAEFSTEARRYSASPTKARGGRLEWMPITQLPPQLRPIILGLAPGDVSDPLPLEGAIALFQLRAIEEVNAAEPDYAAIEYAAYYIAGGRSDAARAEAARVRANVDVCDDLYGIAMGQPEEVLERKSEAPANIPTDIALELAKLDAGEVSTTLTRSDGQTLVFLMLCGRTPDLGEEGPTAEDLTAAIRNQRISSFADGYLEQLRAEARIVEE